MKTIRLVLSLAATSLAFAHPGHDAAPATATEAACACCDAPGSGPGHPLKGVIVDVVAEKKALLVKHEEIPGVMRAMTMLLKVDAPTLAAAQKGQAITATLHKHTDGWWLENITPVPTTPPPTL
ncbi:MAG: hypothetical protein RL376_1881 [Verrucomicrobiota bacterium]|jgi:Cu/Ag efflux protein CusF